MAKPEILDSVGFGRPERRVTFEAKESSVFQITKRSNTGGITAFGEHYCTPLLLGASKRDATVLHYRSVTSFGRLLDLWRLGSPVLTVYVQPIPRPAPRQCF